MKRKQLIRSACRQHRARINQGAHTLEGVIRLIQLAEHRDELNLPAQKTGGSFSLLFNWAGQMRGTVSVSCGTILLSQSEICVYSVEEGRVNDGYYKVVPSLMRHQLSGCSCFLPQ